MDPTGVAESVHNLIARVDRITMGPSLSSADSPGEPPLGWRERLRPFWDENRIEGRILLAMSAVFLAIYFMPTGTARFDSALLEGVYLVYWYTQEHVILCLLPALLIVSAIAAYISQGADMRFLGPAGRNRLLSAWCRFPVSCSPCVYAPYCRSSAVLIDVVLVLVQRSHFSIQGRQSMYSRS